MLNFWKICSKSEPPQCKPEREPETYEEALEYIEKMSPVGSTALVHESLDKFRVLGNSILIIGKKIAADAREGRYVR